MKKNTVKAILSNVFKIAFAGGLIYWLVSSGRFDVQSLRQLLQPRFAIIAFLTLGASFFFAATRWRTLLLAQGFTMSFFEAVRLTFIGIFFNFAMPGGVGGDLIKGYYVVKSQPQRKFDAAMTILMDRVFGLYVMVVMAAGSVFVGFDQVSAHPRMLPLIWIISLIFLAFTTGLALGFSKRGKILGEKLLPAGRLSARVFQVWQGLIIYRNQPWALVKVGALSVLTQVLAIGFFVQAGAQLGFENIPISVFFISCLIGTMITAIPISPAGIGVGQAAFAFLFTELAGPSAATLGAGLATAGQGFQFAWGLVGAFFYVRIKKHPTSSELESLETSTELESGARS